MADDSAPLADKAQPPATFSSFINKNTSAKKFAPKAARRRPGAAAAAVAAAVAKPSAAAVAKPSAALPASSSSLPTPALSNNAAPTPPTTAPSSTAATTQQPPATQQPHATPAIPATQQPPATPATSATPATPASEPTPPTPAQQQPLENDIEQIEHIEPARSPKRRRIDPPSPQGTPKVPVAVMVPPQDAQSESASASNTEPSTSTDATPPPHVEASAHQNQRRPAAPWTAVNHPQDDDGEPPAKKKRAPPKPRGKRATPEAAAEEGQALDNGDGEEAEPTTRSPARVTGTQREDAVEVGEDGEAVAPPTKKPRNPRKDKGKQRAEQGQTVDGENGQDGDAPAKPKRKPRAPKKKSPAEAKDGSEEPKRRGRPAREDTPPDAEEHIIDPDMMCMDDLASRNIRVGRLSRREREMRKIDWDAVKERRREEDARHISTKETQAAVDKLLESGQVETAPTGPRYHVVDGRIELIQDSGTIDRERDADREIDAMLITEEDDLTTRITNRSFMKNNKRFPNEFVLPGQGKRWNHQSTDLFYQGLRSFGTDFQMIAHMFPGMTRRSIKTKFTREERENPDIVRDCLRGKSELASHWDHFLAASQMQEESFADADAIKRDLEEEEARMREQINDALREKDEREKQKKLAGLTDDGDGADNLTGKGKKKRKQKDKTVTFQEEGVEIVGDVDDDPNWGQE